MQGARRDRVKQWVDRLGMAAIVCPAPNRSEAQTAFDRMREYIEERRAK